MTRVSLVNMTPQRIFLSFFGFLAVFCGVLGFAHNVRANAVYVDSVRFGQHNGYTRFVMEVSGKVDYSITSLPDPYRIVVDFPEIDWRLPSGFNPKLYGGLDGFRYGLFKEGTSRVVLDATSPLRVKNTMILPPRGKVKKWRFVMDLEKTDRAQFMAQMKKAVYPGQTINNQVSHAPSAPEPKFEPQAKPVKKDKFIVVIDAGHGGVDPGASGVSGAYEKHITLAVAKQLRAALDKTGRYKVILTRDRDIFIPLRERTAIARRAGADLFISLHADTIRNRSIRGASVYTLSERASSKEAQALAERENKADLIAGIDLSQEDDGLSFILLDMAQRDTKNKSSRFAETLVRDLSSSTAVLRNPHRFAGFAVLKAPDVPSVLIELGFLSNKSDEKNLRSKAHRNKVAQAIATSVNRYFNRVEEASRL